MCPDFTKDLSVGIMKKFTVKACSRKSKKKLPFGSDEVRRIWDKIDEKEVVHAIDFKDLRTFMMAVFQHKTFCRFSDLQKVTLGDVLHDVDFFKIHV